MWVIFLSIDRLKSNHCVGEGDRHQEDAMLDLLLEKGALEKSETV